MHPRELLYASAINNNPMTTTCKHAACAVASEWVGVGNRVVVVMVGVWKNGVVHFVRTHTKYVIRCCARSQWDVNVSSIGVDFPLA